MPLRIPKRTWLTLDEAGRHWNIDEIELRHWLTSGWLKAHVWLPIMIVIRRDGPRDGDDSTSGFHHWEGYTVLSRYQCRRLFRRGTIRLRDITDDRNNRLYALPDSADDLVIKSDDLVILEENREPIERILASLTESRGNVATDRPANESSTSREPCFRSVRLGHEIHHFGSVQSSVIQLLYRAAAQGRPWRNGKQLLRDAGSQCYTLSNLFKRKPAWRLVIVSDGRGRYRLNETLLASVTDQARPWTP